MLNPNAKYYGLLKYTLCSTYEDNYWGEDALVMERNSRDFVTRIARINQNAEVICQALQSYPCGKFVHYHISQLWLTIAVREIYYPKLSPTKALYDSCRNPGGGYGGLLSVTFNSIADAIAFYDVIEIAKGPSLGTNFTLW